jgi:hypothetical protein
MAGYIGTNMVNLSTSGGDIINDVNVGGSLTAAAGNFGALVTGRAVVGGTSAAITLTTGLGLTALTTGMQIRFRATSTNGGVFTINVDGIGAVTGQTVTGISGVPNYLRTDADTLITYSAGGVWICSREVEKGSNANGTYTRWEDGTQICSLVTSHGSLAGGVSLGPITWTYPIAFNADATWNISVGTDFTFSFAQIDIQHDIGSTTNSATFARYRFTNTSGSAAACWTNANAVGRWY